MRAVQRLELRLDRVEGLVSDFGDLETALSDAQETRDIIFGINSPAEDFTGIEEITAELERLVPLQEQAITLETELAEAFDEYRAASDAGITGAALDEKIAIFNEAQDAVDLFFFGSPGIPGPGDGFGDSIRIGLEIDRLEAQADVESFFVDGAGDDFDDLGASVSCFRPSHCGRLMLRDLRVL